MTQIRVDNGVLIAVAVFALVFQFASIDNGKEATVNRALDGSMYPS